MTGAFSVAEPALFEHSDALDAQFAKLPCRTQPYKGSADNDHLIGLGSVQSIPLVDADVGQVPVPFIKVQAVAYNESVWNLEADELYLNWRGSA